MQFSSISGTTRGLHAGVRGRPVFAVLFWSMLCQDEPQPVALAPQRWSSQGVFGSFGKLVAPLTRSTSRIDYQTMMCFMQVATKDKEQVQNKFAFVLYQMSMWIGTLTRDPMHQFVVTPYKLRRIMVYVTQSSAGHNMAFLARLLDAPQWPREVIPPRTGWESDYEAAIKHFEELCNDWVAWKHMRAWSHTSVQVEVGLIYQCCNE